MNIRNFSKEIIWSASLITSLGFAQSQHMGIDSKGVKGDGFSFNYDGEGAPSADAMRNVLKWMMENDNHGVFAEMRLKTQEQALKSLQAQGGSAAQGTKNQFADNGSALSRSVPARLNARNRNLGSAQVGASVLEGVLPNSALQEDAKIGRYKQVPRENPWGLKGKNLIVREGEDGLEVINTKNNRVVGRVDESGQLVRNPRNNRVTDDRPARGRETLAAADAPINPSATPLGNGRSAAPSVGVGNQQSADYSNYVPGASQNFQGPSPNGFSGHRVDTLGTSNMSRGNHMFTDRVAGEGYAAFALGKTYAAYTDPNTGEKSLSGLGKVVYTNGSYNRGGGMGIFVTNPNNAHGLPAGSIVGMGEDEGRVYRARSSDGVMEQIGSVSNATRGGDGSFVPHPNYNPNQQLGGGVKL